MTGQNLSPHAPAMCVLGSGSKGNCTVVCAWSGKHRHVWLIDAGLSPRSTRFRLAQRGLRLDHLEGVILTHTDTDHWHPDWSGEWSRALPRHVRLYVHQQHATALEQMLWPPVMTRFAGAFELADGVHVVPLLAPHDERDVATFRIVFRSTRTSLGYATDLGHVPDALVAHLRHVDVLAIESNYCPRLQRASSRPWYLKQRIMGGRGHLSNEEAREAVERIAPRRHVVLLHLSRECNRPELAEAPHRGAPYRLTVATQDHPSPWVAIGPDA